MRDECSPRGRKSLRLGGCGRRQVAAGSRFAFLTQKRRNLRVFEKCHPLAALGGRMSLFGELSAGLTFMGQNLRARLWFPLLERTFFLGAGNISVSAAAMWFYSFEFLRKRGCMQHELLWHLSAAEQFFHKFLALSEVQVALNSEGNYIFTYKTLESRIMTMFALF